MSDQQPTNTEDGAVTTPLVPGTQIPDRNRAWDQTDLERRINRRAQWETWTNSRRTSR